MSRIAQSLSSEFRRTNVSVRAFHYGSIFIALLTGSVSLCGWIFRIPELTTLGFGLADPVKVTTGVGFLFMASTCAAWMLERRGSQRASFVRVFSAYISLLLGCGSLVLRTFAAIDDTIFRSASSLQMSVNTSLALTSLGLAWVIGARLADSEKVKPGAAWTSQAFSIFAVTIGYVAIIGHAYSASLLYGFSRDVNMALPSAVTVFGLGLSAFFRFDRAAAAADVLDVSIGGRLVRAVVLSAALIIPMIGAIRLVAQDLALVDTRLGAALFAATNVLLLAAGIWIGGRRLNQFAASERFVRHALSDQAALLELRVRERTAELETSESRFRLLADAAPVLILLSDTNLRVESMNAMATAFLGKSVGPDSDIWTSAVHSDDLPILREESRRSFELKSAFSLQMRVRRVDGEYRWMEARGVPRLGPHRDVIGFIGICLDVTDAHLAREELSHALESVEQALSRERILRREIDHRVRNNISSLLGLTAFYESSVRSDPHALAVTAALRGKIRAMKEVHDLVVRTGGRLVNIPDLWSRLVTAMVADDLQSRIRTVMPALPMAKPNQASALAIVLQELLSNSSKHGALGSLGGEVRMEWKHDGDSWLLEWNDTNASIAPVKPVDEESGLGLELIRGLVGSDLQGTCEFRSDPGSWTCRIRLKIG